MKIQALVWGENIHEQDNAAVQAIYPDGMHEAIARLLRVDGDIEVQTVLFQDPDHGLTQSALSTTDVLIFWAHRSHHLFEDAIVERVLSRISDGMGLIVLHSAHFSKIFMRLMQTDCGLQWRVADERERLWVVNPQHPIAAGLPAYIELEQEEMYGEPFKVREPDETVFLSWFEGGEVFRSGLTYRHGLGKVFYFQPGHQTYPSYHYAHIGQVLRNAVRWARLPEKPIVS